MKNLFLISVLSLFILTSCDDDNETVMIDTSLPEGTFTAQKSGSFMEQNGTGSTGTAQLGTDSNGTQFLAFGSNFMTNLGTGTVTVYLSTSMDYVADPANGNPDLRLAGIVQKNGQNYYKLDPAAEAKFTHVILWCGSASIPFGYAALQ